VFRISAGQLDLAIEHLENFLRLNPAYLSRHHAPGHLHADIAILIIEHDMGVVFRFAHEIVVLAQGRVLARGSPADPPIRACVRSIWVRESAPD
jgi:ABC-type hemin transport system ATPase subunit